MCVLNSFFFKTVTPTFAPTDDCIHFIVGDCPCTDGSMLDIAIVLDGSNTVADADAMFYGKNKIYILSGKMKRELHFV